MSADNGVYILKSPIANSNSVEYRVAHAMAIENIHLGDENTEEGRRENDEYIIGTFKRSRVFTDLSLAFKEAEKIHNKYGWTEYGIVTEEIKRPFPK
jgi:hypothetical protein